VFAEGNCLVREVYCEFLLREYLPDGRVRVLIGAAGDAKGLEDLEDGEVILLRCSDLESLPAKL
jgi:hypothetical protein